MTPPHEVQVLSGNAFTTRVFKEKGTYYVRVRANHPVYRLRTTVYEVPPYTQPADAMRAAVDSFWALATPRTPTLRVREAFTTGLPTCIKELLRLGQRMRGLSQLANP